jgi:hypothetical protein
VQKVKTNLKFPGLIAPPERYIERWISMFAVFVLPNS